MNYKEPGVLHQQQHIGKSVLEVFSDTAVLSYFNKQIRNFADAVHFGPHSNIEPGRIEQVKHARSYLNEVYSGYTELPCKEILRFISLEDILKDEKGYTPCIVTFLHDMSKEYMYDELNTLIGEGSIKGVADGYLTTSFVRARLFETGKLVQNTIVIPKTFQKKVSPAKNFFRAVVLSRSVDCTNASWKFFPETMGRGMSILAFQ